MKCRVVPNDTMIPEIGRLIKDGMQVTMTPKGVSMLPFIRGGRDSVLLGKPEDIRTEDIVLVELPGPRYVLHRIEMIEGKVLTLMGDGNIAWREVCEVKDVIALALKIFRNGEEIDCRSASEKRKARIWRRLLPLRRYLLAIYKRIIL